MLLHVQHQKFDLQPWPCTIQSNEDNLGFGVPCCANGRKRTTKARNYIWMFCKSNMHVHHGDRGKSLPCLWESQHKAQLSWQMPRVSLSKGYSTGNCSAWRQECTAYPDSHNPAWSEWAHRRPAQRYVLPWGIRPALYLGCHEACFC